MSLRDVMPSVSKSWFVMVVSALLLLAGGVGTCTKYIGPVGVIQPERMPNLSDVWQVLDAPTKNSVPGLELPAPTQISPNRKFIIVAAKCANPVRWLISAKSGQPVEVLESKLTNSVLIFTTGQPKDVIVVLAYSTVNTQPTDTAITFITIADKPPPTPTPEPNPTPNPAPEPTPAKVPAKLHVTFLLDFSKQTRAVFDIINSTELRQWLTSNGHKMHEVSIQDAAKFNLDQYIDNKVPPLLILQAQEEPGIKEGTLVEPNGVTQLYSIQGVKDAVLKATKKE